MRKILNCWQSTWDNTKYGVTAGDIIIVERRNGKRVVTKERGFQFYFYVNDNEAPREYLEKAKIRFEESGEFLKVFYPKVQFQDEGFKTIILDMHAKGIQTYEADLGPAKRWMIDNGVEIEDFDNIDLYYVDIETDDSSGEPIVYKRRGSREFVDAKWPILSVAFVDRKGNEFFFYNKAKNKEDKGELLKGEKSLLYDVVDFVNKNVDMLVGWNSSDFDMEFLRQRMKLHKINMFYFWNVLHEDMMKRTKYFYLKDPEARQTIKSYSLGFISNHFLGETKVSHTEKIFEMYRDNFDKFKQYNLQDCHLLRKLEDKLGMIRLTYQMFQICGMPAIDWAMIKNIDTFMLRASNKKGVRHKTGEAFINGWMPDDENLAYLGAFVIDPPPGRYKDVYDLDFKSLYPNIIRTFNISPDTYMGEGIVEGCIVTPGIGIDGTKRGQASYAKVPGTIPEEITRLLDEREKIRSEQKKEKDPVKYRDLNVKQLVVKELANSIYGAIGNKGFRGSSMNMAESITGTGQFLLTQLSQWIQKKMGCKVIYGDTDSMFITIPEGENIENIIDGINDHIPKMLKKYGVKNSTIKIQLDKKYDDFFIEAKKKYAGTIGGKTIYVGMECIKRDVTPIARDAQKDVLSKVFNETPVDDLKRYVKELRRFMLEEDVDPELLAIHKSMSKDAHLYRSKSDKGYTAPIQVRVALAMKNSQGDKTDLTKAGSIISFVVTKDADLYAKPKTPLEAVHISEFDGTWDRKYYWNSVVFPPVCRMLEIAYPEVKWDKFYIGTNTPTAIKRAAKEGIVLPVDVITEPD